MTLKDYAKKLKAKEKIKKILEKNFAKADLEKKLEIMFLLKRL